MRTIIAGSRDIPAPISAALVLEAVRASGFQITEVVSGNSGGIDLAGEAYALSEAIPLTRFPADWRAHGKAAGPKRNRQMALYAEALVAVWDGKSRGTADMIRAAKGLKIYVLRTDREDSPCPT